MPCLDIHPTLWVGTDGGLTLYRDGVFTSYTSADGSPGGAVFSSRRFGSGQFYMREGSFISAPPEYQAQDMKLYLAPSGAQHRA